jgi:hypothetical protein
VPAECWSSLAVLRFSGVLELFRTRASEDNNAKEIKLYRELEERVKR